MKKQLLAMLVVAILAITSSNALAGESYIELISYRQLGPTDDYPDEYEYVYDVIGGSSSDTRYTGLTGFDATTAVSNLHDGWNGSGKLYQFWDGHSVWAYPGWGYWQDMNLYPSYWIGGEWVLPGAGQSNAAYGYLNEWHDGPDYGNGWNFQRYPATASTNGLHFDRYCTQYAWTGLLHTFRVVSPHAGLDDAIGWYAAGASGLIFGPYIPPPPRPGDFNNIDGVNDVDIDMLCDFIRDGMAYDVLYDISADGTTEGTDDVVDTLDLDYLIRFLVDTTLGEGTEYGDFNLDGVIDTTDLTRLATNYGSDDWKWDDGNANRYIDTDIDNTDLTILATYFGFGEPDVVPEPASAGLLLLGASAVLRRRRKAKR